jgi:hypothetical protein
MEYAAKNNVDEETAAFALRDFELAVANARFERAHELEAAIRTIRDHRSLVASRTSTSRRNRARG